MPSDDEGLQHMALDRQLEAGHAGELGRVAGAGERQLAAADEALGGLDADGPAIVDADAGDLAILDDVDAAAVGAAGIAPGDGIMPHGAAAALQQAAHDREAAIVEIEEGQDAAHAVAVEQLGIDAVQPHGVAAAGSGIALRIGMEEIEDAALRHHGVEVEFLLQPLPELQRPFVEGVVAGEQVVRADDGGVAADIAGAEPALLQHRDIADAVLAGEVVGGGEPVAAAADDDDVIVGLGLGLAPSRRPVPMAAQRVADEREEWNNAYGKSGASSRASCRAPTG